jgi:hypothetical protein
MKARKEGLIYYRLKGRRNNCKRSSIMSTGPLTVSRNTPFSKERLSLLIYQNPEI